MVPLLFRDVIFGRVGARCETWVGWGVRECGERDSEECEVVDVMEALRPVGCV